MQVQIDHIVVDSREKDASASLLANLHGVPWEKSKKTDRIQEQAISGYDEYRAERASVYVNSTFTLDFIDSTAPKTRTHLCFRVNDETFDAIVERMKINGIGFRSEVHGPIDFKINTGFGGKRIYWDEPDNQNWEILTVSYARRREV
jgi:hypothetical protein